MGIPCKAGTWSVALRFGPHTGFQQSKIEGNPLDIAFDVNLLNK